MTAPLAKESLVIIVDGEEVPGLIFYGLMARGSRQLAAFPSDAWISKPLADEFTLHGEAWEILIWEIPLDTWPWGERWLSALWRTLQAMIANGARVAWVGSEGLPFADPPELFSPDRMSGGVLAWMTENGTSGGSLDPDLPLRPVDDETLRHLRTVGEGLADVT